MEPRIEQELQATLLGRAGSALPQAQERPGEHLHYDRAAHAWRTHEELGRIRAASSTTAAADALTAGCA